MVSVSQGLGVGCDVTLERWRKGNQRIRLLENASLCPEAPPETVLCSRSRQEQTWPSCHHQRSQAEVVYSSHRRAEPRKPGRWGWCSNSDSALFMGYINQPLFWSLYPKLMLLLKVTCGLWFPKQGSEVKSVCPFAFLTVPRVQLSPPPASKFRHLSVHLWFPPHWLPQPPESCLLLSLSLWIGTSPSTLTLGCFQSKAEINRCVYIIDLLLLHLWLGKYRN